MIYQGSKRRIAKDIIPIMLKFADEETIFYDIFCGGGNLIAEVPLKNRFCSDINCYVIEALKQIQKDVSVFPKENSEFNRDLYNDIKRFKEEKYPKWLIGYVGTSLSWGGKWFASFIGDLNFEIPKDYVKLRFNEIKRQQPKLKGIKFQCSNYKDIKFEKNSIIYCDPPYRETTRGYKKSNFNYEEFYNFLREKTKQGYKIFISEYQMPKDFTPVWEKQIHNSLKKGNHNTEKLFVHKDFYLENKSKFESANQLKLF